MHQIGWGFAPHPTAELIQRFPKPVAVFRGGLVLNAGERRGSSNVAVGRKKVGAYADRMIQ